MSAHGNTPQLHRAAVVTPGYAYYGDGSMVPLAPHIHRDLSAALHGTLGRFAPHSTLILDSAPHDAYVGQSGRLRAGGWNHSEVGPWTLFHRSDGRTVAVGFRASMHPVHHLGALFDADTDPGVTAVLLDRYAQVTGYAWRGTFATTSLNALRLTWENSAGEPRWRLPKIDGVSGMGRLEWTRPLTDRETEWGYVHTFDANRAYLGAAINVDVAWSVLTHSGARPFDYNVPGYWRVQLDRTTLDTLLDANRPPVVFPGNGLGQTWMTTPMVKLLAELGDPCVIVDSWTASDARRVSGRVLRQWGEQLRDAHGLADALPPALRATISAAVKRTYKDAVGGMQRAGMRIERPDWAHTLIDLWRATLYRRILRVHAEQGVWPVRVMTDSLAYADCAEWPQKRGETSPLAETLADSLRVACCAVDACGCAPRRTGPLGTFKHEATTASAAWGSPRARLRRAA